MSTTKWGFLTCLSGNTKHQHQFSNTGQCRDLTHWKKRLSNPPFYIVSINNPHTSAGLFHRINHHNWGFFYIQKEKESHLNYCHCQSLLMVDSEAAWPRLWWCAVPAKKFRFYYNIEGPSMFLVCFQSSQRMVDEYSENADLHPAGPWKSSKSCLYLMKSVQRKKNCTI